MVAWWVWLWLEWLLESKGRDPRSNPYATGSSLQPLCALLHLATRGHQRLVFETFWGRPWRKEPEEPATQGLCSHPGPAGLWVRELPPVRR